MPLFTPPPPKGIYEQELHYVESELASSSFGASAEKLTSRHIAEVMDQLRQSMDPDTQEDIRYGRKYVSASEVESIVSGLPHCGVPFTPQQIAHVSRVLHKYVDIEKRPGMFSL